MTICNVFVQYTVGKNCSCLIKFKHSCLAMALGLMTSGWYNLSLVLRFSCPRKGSTPCHSLPLWLKPVPSSVTIKHSLHLAACSSFHRTMNWNCRQFLTTVIVNSSFHSDNRQILPLRLITLPSTGTIVCSFYCKYRLILKMWQ